jgi:hypothetical protein
VKQLENVTTEAEIHALDRVLVVISVDPEIGEPIPSDTAGPRLRQYTDGVEQVRVLYFVTALRTVVVVAYLEVQPRDGAQIRSATISLGSMTSALVPPACSPEGCIQCAAALAVPGLPRRRPPHAPPRTRRSPLNTLFLVHRPGAYANPDVIRVRDVLRSAARDR